MRTGGIGLVEVCKSNTTESGKTGGGRAGGIEMRVRGLLPGAKITKSLLAVPPPMTGLAQYQHFMDGRSTEMLLVEFLPAERRTSGRRAARALATPSAIKDWMEVVSSAARAEGPE